MLTSKYMRIISVFGIIALLALQYVWLRNAYLMVERDMMEKSKECLRKALEEDVVNRLDYKNIGIEIGRKKDFNPKDKIFKRGEFKESAEIFLGMEDLLCVMGYPCSITRVDTIFQKKIVDIFGFKPEYSLQIINDSTRFKRIKMIIELHRKEASFPKLDAIYKGDSCKIYDVICGNSIFIKLDSNQSIQLTLTSPATSVITKAKYIFIVSILLVLLIGVILLFQLKSMVKAKAFTAFMKDYTRILAHEMRTPVNDIYMLTSRILSDKTMDSEKINLYNKEKLNQCSKLLLEIDNILLLAKAEQARIMIMKSKIDMHQFLDKITEKYKNNYFQRKSLKIEANVKPEDCSAYIDPDLMENVVLNLIENAIKYSKEEVTISISCSVEEGRMRLQVKDNGLGISKTDQKYIFQQFQRGTNVPGNHIKGFGIGLYYVDKVVKAHQGKIDLISEEGVGSEFIIDIPNRFL